MTITANEKNRTVRRPASAGLTGGHSIMRKQFLIPVLAGILALGAAQAFAQTATVVMRNGERVRADIVDMGRNFTLNVNGQMRQVPLGDIVLIDFAGDGRNIPAEEISKANASK